MDFYDLLQNYRLVQVNKKAAKINLKAEDLKINIKLMQEQLNYLSIVVLALSELLEESGISKEKILNKIHDIDMRDGRLDNKTKASRNICPACHRHMSVRHTLCMYCGTPLKKENIL